MPQSKTNPRENSPYKIQVLDRAVALLEVLSQEGPDHSLVELSHKLKLHKSTAHRLIMVLEGHKLIERNSVTGRYRLGLKLFELGTRAVAELDLRGRARPYLDQIVMESGETVHLCILDDTEVVYVDKVEPTRSVRMASSVGRRNPAYCTAVGKALMAYLPEDQVENILGKQVLKPLTRNTITTIPQFKLELANIRACGYSIDDEENEEGVRCVGCVVRGCLGELVAAISVSGPSFRLTKERAAQMAHPLMDAARNLSVELGFLEVKSESAKGASSQSR